MIPRQRPAENRYEDSMIPKTPSHFARPWLTVGFYRRLGEKLYGFTAGVMSPC